jgi:hypothetical protein
MGHIGCFLFMVLLFKMTTKLSAFYVLLSRIRILNCRLGRFWLQLYDSQTSEDVNKTKTNPFSKLSS